MYQPVVYQPLFVHRPRPVVIFHQPLHVVPSYVAVRSALFSYPRLASYRYKEKLKGNSWKYKYKYKDYSPFKLGPVYEYEYKYDRGRIEIEEDFD